MSGFKILGIVLLIAIWSVIFTNLYQGRKYKDKKEFYIQQVLIGISGSLPSFLLLLM